MGGFGSSRWSGHSRAHQVEWSLVLDASLLAGGRAVPGYEGAVRLRAQMCAWWVEAQYIVRNDGELKITVWVPTAAGFVRSDIELTTSQLVWGGERVYFRCPGVPWRPACGARVAKLYWPLLALGGFACRRCHQLAYRSSQERSFTLEQLRQQVQGSERSWPELERRQRSRPLA